MSSSETIEEHTHYHGVDRASEHVSVDNALNIFLGAIKPVGSESVSLKRARGRVLFEEVVARSDLPERAKSTRDGYAVNLGNSGNEFDLIGEVRIGEISRLVLQPGKATKIATGAFLPKGTDSVVMKEYAEVRDGKIRVSREIKRGENILSVGEDIKKGDRVLRKGTALYPYHIALLSLLKIARLKVYKKPKVAFFSTGDELQDLNLTLKPNKIPDANRPFIKSSVESLNAESLDLGIAKDDEEQIRSKIQRGLKVADALILSAGSSVGERDYVSKAAESFENVRMLVHGVAMRPSSPTGLAEYDGKPFILLPGFPTSAIVSFFVFARPAIWKLSGMSDVETPMMRARISEGIQARKGVRQFVRVQVSRKDKGYVASIVRPTEAQYSSWMKTANGIAVIDENDVGPNDEVKVFLIGDLRGEI